MTKAHELLKNPENWTKGFMGVILSNNKTCWCIEGAIHECYPDIEQRKEAFFKVAGLIKPKNELESFEEEMCVIDFNDNEHTSHEMVLDLLLRADV